jgi:hypothetical protein
LKKKNATPVAQSKESLAKAKETKRASQTGSNILVAGLVGLMLAEEGYAATANKSNEESKGTKKSGSKKTAEANRKEVNANAESAQKDSQKEAQKNPSEEAQASNSSQVLVSGNAAEIAEQLAAKPAANANSAGANNKSNEVLESTLGANTGNAASTSNAPANSATQVVFPAPAQGASQSAGLLQDEQAWLAQSLAKTSKGLGGIFFSEAPNSSAITNALQIENANMFRQMLE